MPIEVVKVAKSPFWQAHGTVVAPNGARERVRESTRCRNRADALTWARDKEREVLARLTHGEPPPAKRITFADVAAAYISRPEFIHPFDLRRIEILGEHFGDELAAEIDGAAFAAFCHERLPGRKAPTIARWRSTMMAVLNHGAGNFKGLTVQTIPSIEQPRPRPVWLPLDIADRFVEHYHPTVRPAIELMRWNGARTGEALRLDWAQVTLDSPSPTAWLQETKNDDPRMVLLHPRAVAALRAINRERVGRVFLTPEIRNSKGKVVAGGKPYRDNRLTGGSPIKTAHKAARRRFCWTLIREGQRSRSPSRRRETAALVRKIRKFGVHKWRSHWASWMVMKAKVDAHTLKELGGWKSLASVQHYVALAPEHLRDAIDRL